MSHAGEVYFWSKVTFKFQRVDQSDEQNSKFLRTVSPCQSWVKANIGEKIDFISWEHQYCRHKHELSWK